jgi:hypothetical protein
MLFVSIYASEFFNVLIGNGPNPGLVTVVLLFTLVLSTSCLEVSSNKWPNDEMATESRFNPFEIQTGELLFSPMTFNHNHSA